MQIIMPKLGLTTTHGTITEWLKAPGDAVKAEEALCVYETEKVTLELPAPQDGILVEILAPAGATVPVGTPVCEFRTAAEERRSGGADQRPGIRGQESGDSVQYAARNTQYGTPLSNLQPLTATPKARALARQLGVDLATVAGSGPGGRIQAADLTLSPPTPSPLSSQEKGEGAKGVRGEVKATPLARRIAASEGVDLTTVRGTGPEGTITREDVEQAIRGQASGGKGQVAGVSTQHAIRSTEPPSPTGTLIPHSSLRRTIAERMTQSAFTAPHVTLFTEAEATNLVSARAQLNQELPPAEKISYNTLLAALVARALREHPNVNARWEADGIRLLPDINIALAVDTQRGLLTPVLRGVDKLSLRAIQAGFAGLADRALAGKSLPEDFADGTFTITNLGSLDVDGFTPIINPPQAAILGVGRIVEKPVARDGAVVIRPMITLSLSFDHRIVDGAPAARFLQRVKQLVERPMALLLG
ncbi:MAG: dihydrolipoamide acetyltransferase family protein [Anaerolineae bacterium]